MSENMSFEIFEKFRSSFYALLPACTQNLHIAAGVSGGADSVCMLLLLKRLFEDELYAQNCTLSVVTINHRIRPKEETDGDALFVQELCHALNLPCRTIELETGLVDETARLRGGGTEDAARFLRYQAFESFITENNISAFCLAHNENDFYETALMRLFQGSTSLSLKEKRGAFIRPLLHISRRQIEEYLSSLKQDFRIDSTNSDEKYFRNNIRLNLVPLLDEKFPSWKKGLSSFCEKNGSSSQSFTGFIPGKTFTDLSLEQKKEALCSLYNEAGYTGRVSGPFLNDVCFELSKAYYLSKIYEKSFDGYTIKFEKNRIFLEKGLKKPTETGFFAIIEEDGDYSFPFGKAAVKNEGNCTRITFGSGTVTLDHGYPFIIRSPMTGDSHKKDLFLVERL